MRLMVSAGVCVCLLFPGIVWAGESPPGKGVDLAELGNWDIVVANDAIPVEVYAAEEFQALFKEASGNELPIVREIDRPDRHVFIGESLPMRATGVGFSVGEFEADDLRIVVRDGNIAIAGGRPRGTLYGVYTFLEDYCGVRFLTPDHTHVPALGAKRVVGPVDRFYRPPFGGFRYPGYASQWLNPAYGVRMRNNGFCEDDDLGGQSEFFVVNHTFYRHLPAAEYRDDHPEYFCLFDGKRMIDPGGHLQGNNPCYAAPDVLDIITEAALVDTAGALSRGRRNVAVAQNDTAWCYCQCPQCAAVNDREGTRMGSLLEFVNKVADNVAEVYPNVEVGTQAYHYSRKPPKTIKPRENVQIWMCLYDACHLHSFSDPDCPINRKLLADMKGWHAICDKLYVWTYGVNFFDPLAPYPNLHAIKPNIEAMLDAGVKGIFWQCATNKDTALEMSDLRGYLISNLLWDPTRDTDALIDEFLSLHYGNAAPPIRRYIDGVHAHFAGTDFHYIGDAKVPRFPESLANEGLKAFEEALALADNDAIKARVRKASLCAYRAALEPVWSLKEGKKPDAATAERLRPIADEFFGLCGEWGMMGAVSAQQDRIQDLFERE
ncbi:MAG: DUF4838 domain-containing protein [bacterium]|nr:DUF4838 domain-containing protein [bacterium]